MLLRRDSSVELLGNELEKILKNAAEAGFEAVDLTHFIIVGVGEEKTKALLEKYNLELNCILYVGVAEDCSQAERVVRLTENFRCKKIMLVPGTIEMERTALFERLVDSFTKVVEAANSRGITCVIEDDPNIKIPMVSMAELHALLEAVPGLKMVYDTANMLVAGEDPVEYYKEFAPEVAHMHIKDMRIENTFGNAGNMGQPGIDGRCYINVPHGEGQIDFKSLMEAFRNTAYDGTMALEYMPRAGVDMLEDFKYVKNWMEELLCE